jgi:hypothetical protein
MMRRALLTIAPLLLGGGLLVAGLLYDLHYAGIPYQDPTPQQQTQYDLHSSIASRLMGAGAVLMLAGLLWLTYLLTSGIVQRRRSKT